MRFGRRRRHDDELDINLVPLIDVLLVVLIFMAAATTFTRFTQLQVRLPQAQGETDEQPRIELAISQDGRYAVDGTPVDDPTPQGITQALRNRAAGRQSPMLVINADAQASHQSVINAMQAARLAGLSQLSFAAQTLP